MAMKIEKVLSCICVVMILMSVVPVSVFATNNGDNTAKTSNRSNVLEEAFTEKSFANGTMPFITNEQNSSKVVPAQGDQGECASVVKFKGTATTDENKVDCCTCYGSYYCNVKVEELLS